MVTPEQNEIMFAVCRRCNDVSNEETHMLLLTLMIYVFSELGNILNTWTLNLG
jgi:hypothetical protein